MNYFWAFVIGGGICAAGQILIVTRQIFKFSA